MKILIIDNEENLRAILREMIQKVSVTHHDFDEASGVESGLEKLKSFRPDVVFLDVEMEDGTGFDLLKRVDAATFQLILVTAFNKYAVHAFKFSAIDYLMKPIDPIELSNSLHKATNNLSQRDIKRQLEILTHQLETPTDGDKQIVLRDNDATYFVKVKDILYCMAEGAYTQFYFQSADPILVSRNLHTHEEMLEPSGFIRTHHSCLVNPAHIRMYDRKTESLILDGGHSVPVSQRKRDHVMQLLEKK